MSRDRISGWWDFSTYKGSAHDPIPISYETYQEIQDWLLPLEEKLATLPESEQGKFIQECRLEAIRRWPWWFPHVHVIIL